MEQPKKLQEIDVVLNDKYKKKALSKYQSKSYDWQLFPETCIIQFPNPSKYTVDSEFEETEYKRTGL